MTQDKTSSPASASKRLPKAKQRFVSEMLDNMLAQANA